MLLKRFHSLSSSRAQRTGAQKNPPEHSLSSLVVCPPAANLSHLDEGSGFLTGFPQTHSFVSPFPSLSAILSSIPPPHYPAHHPPIHHPSSHRAFIHPPFVNLSIRHPSIHRFSRRRETSSSETWASRVRAGTRHSVPTQSWHPRGGGEGGACRSQGAESLCCRPLERSRNVWGEKA